MGITTLEAAQKLLRYFANEDAMATADGIATFRYYGENKSLREELLDWAVASSTQGEEAAKAARHYISLLVNGAPRNYHEQMKSREDEKAVRDWAEATVAREGHQSPAQSWAERAVRQNTAVMGRA